MSNIRGGRILRSRGGGSMNRLHTENPPEGSIIPSLMSTTSDLTSSSINSNNDTSQQRVATQSKSGVVRYMFTIENK
jgi:hypothetical protein